jgi:DNA-binding NarL/FixJ family response regulator
MIRVMIVDDHAVVRRGLKQILSEEPDMVTVGEGSNAAELMELLRQHSCDVLVLDISMPGRSGLDVLGELKQTRRDLRVLVLSIHPVDQFAMRVLRAGAAGYLTKETAPEELIGAIRKVHAGGRYISGELAEVLAAEVAEDQDRPRHATLSDREYEVFRLLASGRTVSEIGTELCLSVKTVSTYRARVLEKMGMQTNAQLMHYALTHGLMG